jgi:hypothetical protein
MKLKFMLVMILVAFSLLYGKKVLTLLSYDKPTTEELQLRQLEDINDNLKDIHDQIGRIADKIK